MVPGPVSQDSADRADELNREYLSIDRYPEPQDEDPSRDSKDEANRATEYSRLPDVIASGSRHDRYQGGVHDHLEQNKDAAHDDCGDQIAIGEEPPRGIGEKAEGDNVDGEK